MTYRGSFEVGRRDSFGVYPFVYVKLFSGVDGEGRCGRSAAGYLS
jgi:hypothetical protein